MGNLSGCGRLMEKLCLETSRLAICSYQLMPYSQYLLPIIDLDTKLKHIQYSQLEPIALVPGSTTVLVYEDIIPGSATVLVYDDLNPGFATVLVYVGIVF